MNKNIEEILEEKVKEALKSLYGLSVGKVAFEKTKKEFEGDYTLVVFPYVKASQKKPEDTANEIGTYLSNSPEVKNFNVVKGFLNLTISDSYWLNHFLSNTEQGVNKTAKTIMVEYSSPNTNKPLHLGHVRNNLLGYSVAEILKADGNTVIKANLVNDRGIHICKSMLAWQKFGNGETPVSSGMKGDHLVGKYYVAFDKNYKKEIEELVLSGSTKEEAEKNAPSMKEIQAMLLQWEAGDKETRQLWEMMNGWVYEGFAESYKKLGVDFDKTYYESNTYLLGKDVIKEGLEKNVFQSRADNSVFIDLTKDGLDEKTLLRADGTSVYMTQDLGTAIERFREYPKLDNLIYTVGNEQDYHFKVLFLTLKKLGYKWADGLFHLSYGMVELPDGKMKSREGTVVDADELIDEMINTARETTKELGKIDGFSDEEAEKLYYTIGMGALKYFMLKVDPKKKMLFNPKESIDFNGNTGPFIQYTYARIQSIKRKAGEQANGKIEVTAPNEKEKNLMRYLHDYPKAVAEAASNYSPAVIANYVYELVKEYNQFYHDCPILKEEDENKRLFRLQLSSQVGETIKLSMKLLGIEVPDKM